MKTVKQQLKFIHKGGTVVRFHLHVGHVLDTDARHSHGVAMLVYLLSGGNPSANVLMKALCHDLAEQVVGDIPAPAKRALGIEELLENYEDSVLARYGLDFQVTPEEARMVHLADALDGMLYCCREVALGNRTLKPVFEKWQKWIAADFQDKTEVEEEVIKAVMEIWDESTDIEGHAFDYEHD